MNIEHAREKREKEKKGETERGKQFTRKVRAHAITMTR